MRVHHFLITSTLFAVPVQAQDDAPQSLPSLEAALPADVRQLLASVTTVQSLFPVNGSEPFAGNVLKADVINFSRNSELVLHNVSTPYIVIVAREVKFPDATSSYRVRFDNVVAPQGQRLKRQVPVIVIVILLIVAVGIAVGPLVAILGALFSL